MVPLAPLKPFVVAQVPKPTNTSALPLFTTPDEGTVMYWPEASMLSAAPLPYVAGSLIFAPFTVTEAPGVHPCALKSAASKLYPAPSASAAVTVGVVPAVYVLIAVLLRQPAVLSSEQLSAAPSRNTSIPAW